MHQQVLQLESSAETLLADHHNKSLQLNPNISSHNIMGPLETSETRSLISHLPTLAHFTDAISEVFNFSPTLFNIFISPFQTILTLFGFDFSIQHFLKMIYVALFTWVMRKTRSTN